MKTKTEEDREQEHLEEMIALSYGVMAPLEALSLASRNVEKKILNTCALYRRKAEGADSVALLFDDGGHVKVVVNIDETIESLKAKLNVMRGQGYTEISGWQDYVEGEG
jgi:hypothetical protein